MVDHEIYEMGNGRRVALHRLTDGERAVVFCHPTPGAGNFDPDPSQTTAQSIALFAPDRPGYGGSDPVRDRNWATPGAAADDIAEILGRVGVRSVGVAGWSAGGRVALALAARHPKLVSRAVVVGTPAPEEVVPWIPPQYKSAIETLRGLPPATVHARLAAMLTPLRPADPHALDALGVLSSDLAADAPAFDIPGTQQRLGDMIAEAWTQGAAGLAADIAGYALQPWGFEPAGVEAKVLLLYGEADQVAGPAHGKSWRENLPAAQLELIPEMGHLLIVPLWARVLRFLLEA